jgi:hypothetical protein
MPSLCEVAAERGLTALEVHVMVERVLGRSHLQISRDAVLGGRSRQCVKQMEQRAMRKLGLTVSVEVVVNAAERLDAGMRLRERAGLTEFSFLKSSGAPGRGRQRLMGREKRAELRHERRVTAFLASKGVA